MISGSPWLPAGWVAVGLLVALSLAKLFAASLTIGSGGSAGDFASSLAIGGLFGGAFGRAAQLLTHDPHLQPGAFALVGMGTFYGGIAHVPLSALVLVCGLAGTNAPGSLLNAEDARMQSKSTEQLRRDLSLCREEQL